MTIKEEKLLSFIYKKKDISIEFDEFLVKKTDETTTLCLVIHTKDRSIIIPVDLSLFKDNFTTFEIKCIIIAIFRDYYKKTVEEMDSKLTLLLTITNE